MKQTTPAQVLLTKEQEFQLPNVAGRRIRSSNEDFERACLVHIERLQHGIGPYDGAMLDTFCEAVRLVREYTDSVKVSPTPAQVLTKERGSYLCPQCGSESHQRTGYGNEHIWKCPKCGTEHEPWTVSPGSTGKVLLTKGELEEAQRDKARLDWLMPKISGAEWGYIGVQYSAGCNREAIDTAMRVRAESKGSAK